MSFNEIEEAKKKCIPKTTLNQNKWAENLFDSWVQERNSYILKNPDTDKIILLSETSKNGNEDLNSITKEKLAYALSFFFFEIKKRSGEKYPADTLKSLLASIHRHIRQNRNEDWQMFRDPIFQSTRDALDATMKEATKEMVNFLKIFFLKNI